MKKIIFVLILLISVQANFAQKFFEKANHFFSHHVANGLVDYEAILNDLDALDELVNQIAKADIGEMEDLEKKAFWINAYNITVIKSLVDNWPIENPLNIRGFFDNIRHNIAGERITLNELENDKLRATYHDPRLHFVLVCGAMACPKIAAFAYTPDKVEAQLEERTILALNNDTFIQVDATKKIAYISEIFFWYADDFKMNGLNFITFINQYRKKKIPVDYVADKYNYDWNINKQ